MVTNVYNQTEETVSLLNEPVVAYQRSSGVKNQVINDLYAGIIALKAEQRGKHVNFGSLDNLIVELESGN